MRPSVTWGSGGFVIPGVTVGPDDFKGPFKPSWFYNSVILNVGNSTPPLLVLFPSQYSSPSLTILSPDLFCGALWLHPDTLLAPLCAFQHSVCGGLRLSLLCHSNTFGWSLPNECDFHFFVFQAVVVNSVAEQCTVLAGEGSFMQMN